MEQLLRASELCNEMASFPQPVLVAPPELTMKANIVLMPVPPTQDLHLSSLQPPIDPPMYDVTVEESPVPRLEGDKLTRTRERNRYVF